MTHTAKIAAAQCKDTGVTPELARKWWAKLGSRHIAIVELEVDERTEGVDDAKGIKLVITSVEPADTLTAEHVRELQRALYLARQPDKALTAGVEATPRDIVLRGAPLTVCEHCEHPLAADNINHGRTDSYVACIWVPCRHNVVISEPDRCPCGNSKAP